MSRNKIKQDMHTPTMHFIKELLQVFICAVARSSLVIVGYIIACVMEG